MKRLLAMLAATVVIAGCGTHYRVESDPVAFATRWNQEVPQAGLKLTPAGKDANYLVSDAGVTVTYFPKDRKWLAFAPGYLGPITCTSLLIVGAGTSYDKAQFILGRLTDTKKQTFKDGNIEVYNNSLGGTMCSVEDVGRGAAERSV